MTLGEKVREARERLGWTQAALAQRVGATAGFITKLEKDAAVPGPDLLRALGNVLVLDAAELQALAEQARGQRASQRVRSRGAAAGRPAGAEGGEAAPVPPTAAEERPPASTAEQVGREILADPELRAAYSCLRAAMGEPRIKDAVLLVLEALALKASDLAAEAEAKGRKRGKDKG